RGNVYDSYGSAKFLRETFCTVREEFGLKGCFEVRVDSAFFQREFLAACDRSGVEYAVKVPMWPWLNLRGIVKRKKESDWQWVDRRAGLQGLFAELPVPQWKRTERIAIYRKRINHKPAKGRQLELFNPDDGCAVGLPRWPRGAGENHWRTEKWLCFRIDPHANLQRQHGLAE